MEHITTFIEEALLQGLLSPPVLVLAAVINVVLLSGLGARLIDR